MSPSSEADLRSADLQNSFRKLSNAARVLNAASDSFGKATSTLDAALNELNPGVEAWVTIDSLSDDSTPWETIEQRLGYTKTNGRWGLTLCTVTKDERDDSEEIAGPWLFNDAPRGLRLRAIDHLPELVEALASEAAETADRVIGKANLAAQLSVAIKALSGKGKQ